MIGVTIRAVTTAGPVSATTSARSIVDFEAQFDTSVIGLFTGAGKMTGVYWLAWRSLQLAGASVPSFDEWVDSLVDFEVLGENIPASMPPPLPV